MSETALDDVLAQLLSLPQTAFEGANRYDTDNEHVLHLWVGGQSYDIVWPRETPEPVGAEDVVTYTWDDGTHLIVHAPALCAGRPCVIHAPSDHHMRDWPTSYRYDKNLTERTCPHGVGHPDPDDLAWRPSQDYLGVHGCDGCCARES